MASERTNRPIASIRRIPGGKKVGAAAALAVVMGIMWVRVLVGSKPHAAAAVTAPSTASAAAVASPSPVKVRYLDLPVISGRNDTIAYDFFAGRDWDGFPRNTGPAKTSPEPEVVPAPVDRTRENVDKAAENLHLHATLLDGSHQAFINDELLKVGDTLPVHEGGDLYLFEVKRIDDDSVLVECRGQQVTLKMK
jgi:hypothetical protein